MRWPGSRRSQLTSDRERILLSAAEEIERYIGKMLFRGVGGAPRVATSVVEAEAPFNVPAVGAMPTVDRRDRSQAVEKVGSDEAEDFEGIRPTSGVRLA